MNRRQKLVQQQFLNDEERIIKRLHLIYSQSLVQVNDKIKNLQFNIDNLQLEYDWMDDTDPKKAQVKSMIQSKIYQKQYQEQLQKQLDGILDKMNTQQYLNVSDYLDGCYEDGFVGTMFDMHGQGVPLMIPLDQEAMVRAVQLESKISKGLYTRLGEDVDQLKTQIRAQVSRSIATGMTYAQTAKQLANYSRIGYNKSIRIARTEGHRIQTTAAMDACHKAKERGADVLKQWDATLDDATRESHRQVDGEIRELDESFSNGLDFPSDPAGGAGEVVNCRCALLQRARWALDESELHTLEERAAFYGLDKSETFEDFKKKYLKAVEEVRQPTRHTGEKRIRQRKDVSEQQSISPIQRRNSPDFTSMDRKQLISWASENLKTQFEDVAGANVDYVREAVKVISKLEEKLGGKTINGLSVKFGGTPSGTYAKYDDVSKTVLLKKTGSLNSFIESRQKENERALRKLKKVYHSTETFSGTIWHELGHAVDMDTGQALSAALTATEELELKSIKISVYAASTQNVRVTKRSEAWAENFAAYMDDGATSKDVPMEIIEMINDYFNKKKGR